MRFLLDHDVPEPIAGALARHGHDVERVREILPIDTADDAVLAAAFRSRRVLVTCNPNDFLRLAAVEAHCGIIILVRRRSRAMEVDALLDLIADGGPQGLADNINFA